jgi:hypothetical protein
MIPVFIGWDARETIAWHVLAHSLITNSSEPLALTPIGNDTLPRSVWWRGRGLHDSTDFSNARFLVPALQNFTGWAVFMDCDMVGKADLAKLWAQRDERYAVMCVKHNHVPRETTKFLGAAQSTYSRKNWSSLMLLNCAHPAALTIQEANTLPGLDLHGFQWCEDDEIGELKGLWNVLVTPELQHPEPIKEPEEADLLHFTLGGPWHGYDPQGAEIWASAFCDLLGRRNPALCASVTDRTFQGVFMSAGDYEAS